MTGLAAFLARHPADPAPSDVAVDDLRPRVAIAPAGADDLAQVVADAQQAGLAVVPVGGGTRLGWGRPLDRADVLLLTRRLDRIVDHAAADLVMTLEAGVTLATAQAAAARAGQMIALDVPFADRQTIGGLIATDESGGLRLRYGGLRDLLLGVRFARADGVLAKAGGRVVKNVAGYDLPKLLAGALGTLGVVVEATLRLHPLPPSERAARIVVPDASTAAALAIDLRRAPHPPVALAVEFDDTEQWLIARYGGRPAALDRAIDRAFAIARPCARSVEAIPDSAVVWTALLERPWNTPAALVARVGVLPSAIGEALAASRSVAARYGMRSAGALFGHGLGVVSLFAEGEADPACAGAATELRAALATLGGHLVVAQAPVAVKRRVDVWGIRPDALQVMRAVCERFDPQGTLNPGRVIPLDRAEASAP
ncbi:MAG: FAD-binding oxidoreductase [Dehalococcoidia bacterium]|nr:FAD-binding oxidoreductase [Dehalococcoidia bacterium]